MNDLISREEALKALKETCPTVWTESDYELGQKNQWSSDELAILTVPSAEPKTAVWVGEGDGYVDGEIVLDMWHCSNCYYYEYDEKPNWKYCPNCGAKMDVTE